MVYQTSIMRFSLLFALIVTSSAWCQYSQRDHQTALRRKSELLLQHTNILNKADSALLDWQDQTTIFFANFRLGKNYQAQFESQLSILRDCSYKLASLNDSVYIQPTTEALMRDLVATNAKTTEQLSWYNDFELEEYVWAISRPMDSSVYLEKGSQHEKQNTCSGSIHYLNLSVFPIARLAIL